MITKNLTMRTLTLSVSLTLALSAGLATAESTAHFGWTNTGDDTVRCMAIGCAPGDYERYPEYAPEPVEVPKWGEPLAPQQPYLPVTPDHGRHAPEIGELLRQLQQRSYGKSTAEQVEDAFRRLQPLTR